MPRFDVKLVAALDLVMRHWKSILHILGVPVFCQACRFSALLVLEGGVTYDFLGKKPYLQSILTSTLVNKMAYPKVPGAVIL